MPDLRVASSDKTKTVMSRKGQFFDYTLLVVIIFLIIFGLIMVYSTSVYTGIKDGDPAKYFKKQLFSTAVALVPFLFAVFVNYHFWYKFKWVIYIGSLCSILLVKVLGAGDINGANRWLRIGGLSLQPAEIVKLGLIITLAAFVAYSGNKMKNVMNNLVFLGLTAIPALLALVITNHLSTAIILVAIAYVMILIANHKPWPYFLATAVVAVLGVLLVAYIFNNPGGGGFRFDRILAWKNPEAYASETGFQTIQSMYAIGSGGLFGKGLGQSMQKLGFIPEAHNDMVFAVICEELGLFGGICLIILFIVLIWRLMIIANNAPDLFGSMLVVGVMAHIAVQLVLNIAVVTNSIPNTGISLPFISYGGSSVIFLLTEMGIVLGVSRQIQVPVSVKHRPANKRPVRRQEADY